MNPVLLLNSVLTKVNWYPPISLRKCDNIADASGGIHYIYVWFITLLLIICRPPISFFMRVHRNEVQWASYQIRKIAGCACAGNAGNVFPRRRFQRKPLVSDPGMHHGTCVTHVSWCMSGSLTCGDGENVPGIPGACAPVILRIWQETHGCVMCRWWIAKMSKRKPMPSIHLTDSCSNGPLTRYAKLQVAHAPGMPGTFSPAADFKGNR